MEKLIKLIQNYTGQSEADILKDLADQVTITVPVKEHYYDNEKPSELLKGSFIWQEHPKGHKFWASIHEKLLRKESDNAATK